MKELKDEKGAEPKSRVRSRTRVVPSEGLQLTQLRWYSMCPVEGAPLPKTGWLAIQPSSTVKQETKPAKEGATSSATSASSATATARNA